MVLMMMGMDTLVSTIVCHIVLCYLHRSCSTNVRPAFFYTKPFVDNSVAISLIMIKLLHHTVQGPSTYCEKFQG